MELESGHIATQVEGEEFEKLQRDFNGREKGMVRLTPGRWLYPTHFLKFADKIYNFKFKKSDVVVMTYPKCGTTWTQAIVWTMLNNPDFDHPKAQLPLAARSPFLEFDMADREHFDASGKPATAIHEEFFKLCPGKNPDDGVCLQLAEALPEPRTIKTHLPFPLLSPELIDTSKVVYVSRNPKDTVVSYHHMHKSSSFYQFINTFEEFVEYFIRGDLAFGSYWLHLKEALKRKSHPNFHFIQYEHLKGDPMKELQRLNDFLDTKLTDEQLDRIRQYTSFGEMKARAESTIGQNVNVAAEGTKRDEERKEYIKKEGGFFRKGEVGDWKNKFTPDIDAKIDLWIRQNIIETNINFEYES